MNNLLIYGGSFDPIHYGHLKTALNVQAKFKFEHFVFLPCKRPVLKEPTMASSHDRVAMLQQALQDYPQFTIDLREIRRETPSYMSETLESYRQEFPSKAAITLLLGMDAFLQLPKWHQWNKILSLANLLIIKRPGESLKSIAPELKTLLKQCEIKQFSELKTHPHGKIFQYDAGDYAISSTELRQKLENGEDVSHLLPDSVNDYIAEHQLYCRG